MRNGQVYQQKTEKISVTKEKSLVRLTPDPDNPHLGRMG